MISNWLFKQIDNSSLIIFRVFFGLLITAEAWGAIATGWVGRNLVTPSFTFSFIDFEWLQVLLGPYMYLHFAIMGMFGFCVMIGYKYRWSMGGYTLFWAIAYFLQKSSYNNHYYLLLILCGIMLILPAHRYFSMDAKHKPSIKSIKMPNWCRLLIIAQLWIVYTFASVAKWYPDWLDGTVAANLMAGRANYPIVGTLLQTEFAHTSIVWFGILFDLLIIPALLWKPTRKPAFIISVFFHLFNSFVFLIGIFPYMSLAFTVFFFSAKSINKNLLWWKPLYKGNEVIIPKTKGAPILATVVIVHLLFQIGLPLRQHMIEGNVLWTEEGHKLSWRMMLRSRTGSTQFYVKNKADGMRLRINLNDYLEKKQIKNVSSKPDAMWQFAQHLKREFATKGSDIEVYANSKVSVNGRPYKQLIDDTVDLASVPWKYFEHNEWILLNNLQDK